MFSILLRDASALSLARSSAESRKERKVNEQWVKKVVALRADAAAVKAFMSSQKIKAVGNLLKMR